MILTIVLALIVAYQIWNFGSKKITPKTINLKHSDEPDIGDIDCVSPSDGKFLGKRHALNAEEVKMVVDRARHAQAKPMSFELRVAILSTLLEWITENQDLVSRLVSKDSGKTEIDANFGEILTTCEKLRWTIDNGQKVLKPEYRSTGMIMAHKSARVEWTPVGVMGAIVSWNYPFHNALGPVISALMAGNACVVKCSEQVAYTTGFLQSLMDEILRAYHVDTNLVQFINGYAEAGQALIDYADKITFIGSPGVGKLVMKRAAETLTPVILELGGKDCAIVCKDADYKQFMINSQRLVYSNKRYAFQNCGQNCAGLERVIIHESLYARYLDDICRIVNSIRLGNPLVEKVDCGAITMKAQIGIIQALIDDAVKKGAKCLTGGSQWINPEYPHGYYFAPTVLVDVTPEMRIFTEEVFGPVLIVLKFSTEEEAIKLANGSGFGLGSGIFSNNLANAEKIGSKIKAGFTNINDFGVNYLCQGLPFGGVGISGVDCFAGVEGLRGNCYPKAVTKDKFGVKTKLPSLLQYPIDDIGNHFQKSLIMMLYSSNAMKKIKGAYSMLFGK